MERRRLHMNNSPMADSTRIDASCIGSRPSPSSSFLMTLSPLRRNSVISSSNGSRTPEESQAPATAGSSSSISRQKLNLSQLDPKTFADVHSSGLTSRIVAYHENSLGRRSSGSGVAGLQRSMSVSNLYSPLSHPRRPAAPPLPYKSSVPVLSLTQIAPPERSFYSGNTLPSLMRSNSLVGVALKTSDQEHLSRENRPILHPPHPQHECEPTRSVLEELKEISRKRINSGDTQSTHDFTKRSCQREDFVDHHQHQHHHQQHQHEMHRLQQQHQSFKRQRELTVSVPLRHNLTSLPAPPPASLHHMYSNGAISPRQSPEQVAKRRNCSYSNDIASSLSSSQRHSNKRKLFDMRESLQRSHNETAVSSSSPETSPKSKVQRKVDVESIGRTQSMPIPAVPAVPPARTISAPPAKSHNKDQRPAEAPPAAEKPKLTLFNARQPSKTSEEQSRQDLNSPDVDAGEYAGIQFVKPKQQNSMLGVRNPSVERTQKTKLAIMLSGLKGELYQGEPEESDEPDATLVPPPKGLPTPIKPISLPVVTSKTSTTTITTTTTISMTTTTTSTISVFNAPKTIVSPSKPVILSNQVIVPAATTTAANTSTTVPKLSFGQAKEGETAAAQAPAAAPASAAAAASVAAPSPAAAPTPISAVAPPAASNSTPVTTDKAPEAATLGIQSKFSLPATTLASGLTSAKPLLTFGSPKTSTAPTLTFGSTSSSTITSSSSTAPVFSFGQLPASSNGPTVGAAISFKTETTTPAAINSLGKPNTTLPTFGTSTTTATVLPSMAPPTLSFGSTANTSPFGTATAAAPATSSSMISPPKAAPMFAFGQTNSTGNGGGGNPAEKPAVFSFGGATNGAAESKPTTTFGGVFNTKPEASKPAGIFGSQDNTFGSPFKPAAAAAGAAKSTEPANAFAFKTPTTNNSATAATNLFSFGGGASAAAKPPEPSASQPFGQSGGVAAATPFSFGGAATAAKESSTDVNKSVFAFGGGAADKSSSSGKPSAMLNFGGGDKATPAPAFGSVAPAATPAPAPTSNAFAFGSSTKPSTPMFGSSSGATATPAATKPFAFGAAAQATPTAAAPAPTGGFSFAAAAAASKKTEEPSGANLFGSPAAKPSFSFGGSTTNQVAGPAAVAGATPATAAGGFSFGKKEEPAATNVFGSPASANTGVVKPTFGFGGASNATPQPATAASSGFGGFGAPTATAAAAAAIPQPAAVGGAANQNKPFAFGGSTAAVTPSPAPALGGNLFASAVAATQNQAKPGGFAFGGGAKNATNNSTAGNAPFSFGGAAAGGIASPPSNQSMNTAKPFSFGGAGGNPAPTVFGSPAPAPPASNPGAGAFNFSGGASPAQQANAGNMFAPPPENRPIRKATRRLQK